jgi:outer membrane lipoprotein SlyB
MIYSTQVYSRRFAAVCTSVAAVVALSACAPMSPQVGGYPQGVQQGAYPAATYPAASYPAQNQQGAYVEYGRVNNIEVFQTQGKAQGSGVGALIGGVAGAVVGHQIGGGSGRDAATVVGALGGAVAGNAVEKNRAGAVTESFRISVQMDNGSYRSYDVPSAGQLRTGDRVRIENGQLFRM